MRRLARPGCTSWRVTRIMIKKPPFGYYPGINTPNEKRVRALAGQTREAPEHGRRRVVLDFLFLLHQGKRKGKGFGNSKRLCVDVMPNSVVRVSRNTSYTISNVFFKKDGRGELVYKIMLPAYILSAAFFSYVLKNPTHVSAVPFCKPISSTAVKSFLVASLNL